MEQELIIFAIKAGFFVGVGVFLARLVISFTANLISRIFKK